MPLPSRPARPPVSAPLVPVAPYPAPRALPEDTKRVNPSILLITLLDDLNLAMSANNQLTARMGELLMRMEGKMEAVPRGVVEVFDDLPVTTGEQVFDTVERTEQRWHSATVYNEGPDDIQVRANDGFPWETPGVYSARKSRYITLAAGESIDLDFRAPLLQRIYYRLASGETEATMKVVGEW